MAEQVKSNSPAMTLEERLVQHIKSDSLLALVGDEDAILELTRRAVQEALFDKPRIPRTYGGFDEGVAPVTAAAVKIAEVAIGKLVDAEVEKIVADPAMTVMVRNALADALPRAIDLRSHSLIGTIQDRAAMNSLATLQDAIRNGAVRRADGSPI